VAEMLVGGSHDLLANVVFGLASLAILCGSLDFCHAKLSLRKDRLTTCDQRVYWSHAGHVGPDHMEGSARTGEPGSDLHARASGNGSQDNQSKGLRSIGHVRGDYAHAPVAGGGGGNRYRINVVNGVEGR
jgi:hypothetical protein